MNYSIDVRESLGIRTLHFGSEWVQGAMRIARPYQLLLNYTQEMMLSLILREEDIPLEKILVIGLGCASMAKFLYRHFPQSHIVVAEIDQRVIHCAQDFFKCPQEDERFTIHCVDAFDLIHETDAYDLILVDGFDAKAQAGRLDSTPFYQACRQRLKVGGVMAVNLFNYRRRFKRSLNQLYEVFQEQVVVLPSNDEGNTIVFAPCAPRGADFWNESKRRAQQLKSSTGLNLLPTLARWQKSYQPAK